MASLREIIEANKAKLAAEKQVTPPQPQQSNGKADEQKVQSPAENVVEKRVETAGPKLSAFQRAALAAKEAKSKAANSVVVTPIATPAATPPTLPSGPITKTQVVATPSTAAGAGLTQVTLEQIQGNIKYLAENIEQRDLVGQVVRTIFMQLKQNPQFSTLISDNEFDVITRGFMSAYHAAARKRVEGKEKKSAKAEIKAKVGASVDAMFDDLDKFFK